MKDPITHSMAQSAEQESHGLGGSLSKANRLGRSGLGVPELSSHLRDSRLLQLSLHTAEWAVAISTAKSRALAPLKSGCPHP